MDVNRLLQDARDCYERLRDCYERLLLLLPKGSDLESVEPSAYDACRELCSQVLNACWEIEELIGERVPSDAIADQLAVAVEPGLLRFWENVLSRQQDAIADLLEWIEDQQSTKDEATGSAEADPSPRVYLDDRDPELRRLFLGDPQRFMEYNEESWRRRLRLFRRLVLHDPLPDPVEKRLLEVYRSHVAGNWLSVIALGRATLEYALIERAPLLGFEAYDWAQGTKTLNCLVKEVTARRPALKGDLDQLRRTGNSVLHPPRRGTAAPDVASDSAFEFIRRLVRSLEALYRTPV